MADTSVTVVELKGEDNGVPKMRRFRPVFAVLSVVLLIGLGWVVEIHTFLGHVQRYTVHLQSQLTSPTKEAQTEAPPQKVCAHLNHRDPGFVRDDTKDLCLSADELSARIREIVFTAANLFEAHNLTFFLESGTLLGSFRERAVIRNDKDADLGIDAAALLYLQTHNVTVPDEYYFTVWNSSLYPTSDRDDKLPARLIHKETALYADVFAFLDWKNETTGQGEVGPLPSVCFGGCSKCPKVDGGKHFKVPREWVYPLVDCPFEKRMFKCPRETAKYLEHLYGENYMTPSRQR